MCPPGVDQTTRSPEEWHLLAPLLGERQTVLSWRGHRCAGCGDFHQLLRNDYSFDAFGKLARCNTMASPVATWTTSSRQKSAAIERLPAELISNILHDVGASKTDVVALGLCSRILWMHVLRHIQDDYNKSISPWASTPLICTGTWLEDLPVHMPKLLPEFQQHQEDWDEERSTFVAARGHYRNRMCPARRWNWSAVTSYLDVGEEDVVAMWRKAFRMVSSGLDTSNEPMERDLERALAQPTEREGAWLLRNLTSHEVVQLKVSQAGAGGTVAYVSGVSGLSLDTALLMRTCWSLDDDEFLHRIAWRGVWAGHCFEVIPDDGDRAHEDGWQNVTTDIVQQAVGLKILKQAPDIDLAVAHGD